MFRLGGHAEKGARAAPAPLGEVGVSCDGGAVTAPAPGGGITTETKQPGTPTFVALDVALETIRSLRGVVGVIRKRSLKLAEQIEAAASSVAANVAEGNRRHGKDRLHFFRIAAGSADETRAHLQVAEAWGWVSAEQIEAPMALLDRELGLLWGLTH